MPHKGGAEVLLALSPGFHGRLFVGPQPPETGFLFWTSLTSACFLRRFLFRWRCQLPFLPLGGRASGSRFRIEGRLLSRHDPHVTQEGGALRVEGAGFPVPGVTVRLPPRPSDIHARGARAGLAGRGLGVRV